MFIFQKRISTWFFWKIIWRGKQWCIVTLYLKTYLFSFSKPTLVPTPFPHPIPCTVTISKGSVSDDDFPQLFWDPYPFTLPRYSLNSLEDRAYTFYPTGGICHSNSELKISRIKLQQGLYKYLEICEKAPIFFLFIREFWTGKFPIQKPWISSIIFTGRNISETSTIYICLKL